MANYCTHCGKQIREKTAFCTYCGKKIDYSDATQNVSDKKESNKINQKLSGAETGAEDVIQKETVNTSAKSADDGKMLKKTTVIIVVAVILVVVIAVVGAVMHSRKSSDDATATEAQTTESVEKASSDFDVASNLKITEDGDVKTIETDHVIISAPRGSSWDYQLSRVKDDKGKIVNSFYIYNVDAKVDGYPGRIVEITVCDPDDNYEDWGADVIGEKDGKIILATYFLAGGAECNPDNEQSEEDYAAVLREITYKLKTDSGIHDVEPMYLEQYYRAY